MLYCFKNDCSTATSVTTLVASKAKDIYGSLSILGVDNAGVNRIMDAFNNMASSTHVQGAINFLTEATATPSMREQYYKHSKYIAEYFCTISNIGLFAVGFYYRDYATLFAATFSALSHAIPSQRLHDLDIAGVLLIFGKVAVNYKVLLARPQIAAWGLGALAINLTDTFLTRRYLNDVGHAVHVAWHLAAAFALYKLNQASTEVSREEIQVLEQAIMENKIPNFLKDCYETMSNTLATYLSHGATTKTNKL